MTRRVVLVIGLCLLAPTLGIERGRGSGPPLGNRDPTPSQTGAPAPARIVSLIPAVTEMLFAIGAGDAVVGVSSFDRYPAEVGTRTRVGGLIGPDVERILALRPDLVIVYGTQGQLIERLDRARIPMFNYQHSGLADIARTIRALGARVDHSATAAQLTSRIEEGIAEIRRRVANRPRPRVMIVFDRESGSLRGLYASGGVGFLHDMLEVAGGTNVFADVARQSLQVTIETALARAPDVVLELHSEAPWTPDRLARERRAWQALAALPAVRNDRLYFLVDDKLSIPGPRVVESIQAMARALHPEFLPLYSGSRRD